MWPGAAPAHAQPSPAMALEAAAFPSQDALINEAREALKRRDKSRLEALRDTAQRQSHPLASWIDYWYLGLRLGGMIRSRLSEVLFRRVLFAFLTGLAILLLFK